MLTDWSAIFGGDTHAGAPSIHAKSEMERTLARQSQLSFCPSIMSGVT